MKLSIPIRELCVKNNNTFGDYMQQVRDLKFDEKPDIAGYRKMFQELSQGMGYDYDYVYDW